MANLNLIKPLGVQNIINKFCFTIGMIPSSYKLSLTYEEQILSIGKYLEETVIPALNNNAEAVAELQALFVQLKDYVENYFDDLNIQNEINIKLDEMANSGKLAEIINNEIFEELNNKISQNTISIQELNQDIQQSNYIKSGLSIHLSIDDVESCLKNLENNEYNSLFDEPYFAMLKDLHEKYNACFSLYVYTESFNAITKTSYREDFIKNSNWLKIGYHSTNASTNFANDTYITAKQKYNTFVENVLRICGTNRVIDRVPRFANYVAPLYMIDGTADANCGVIGLLDADDDRVSYNHNQNIINFMKNHYEYFDNISQLFFIKTNLRIENSTNLQNDLLEILKTTNGTNRNIEIFTHEWWMYNGITVTHKQELETICSWANSNNIPFNFVENKIPNMVGNKLIKPLTKIALARNAIAITDGFNVAIDNTTINHLKKYYSPTSYGGFDIRAEEPSKFGCDVVLIAPSTKQIEFHNAIENLQFAIGEYTTNIIQGKNFTPNGMQNNAWFDCPLGTSVVTLQDDTQYYTVCFKNSNNEVVSDNDLIANNVYIKPL